MPRFFFNLRSAEEMIVDSEGHTFRSIGLAKKEALQAARDLIADSIKAGRIVDRARVFEVSNASGEVVLTVPFADAIAEKAN
jgi:hypothetical protein